MTSMARSALKATFLLAATAVAVPYAVALLANVLYGWPIGRDRYARALSPRKVLALNRALLQQLASLRYIRLALRWRYFYTTVDQSRATKNIPYGINNNCLDVYFPAGASSASTHREGGPEARGGLEGARGGLEETRRGQYPVVVFLYGGTWGSGDKSMYGMLCSHLSDILEAIVVCPNYSIYPRGFVDDMVQDVSDALEWVHQYASMFHANSERIALIGHSAGAHLAVLTVLELSLRRLAGGSAPGEEEGPDGGVDSEAAQGGSLSVKVVSLGSGSTCGRSVKRTATLPHVTDHASSSSETSRVSINIPIAPKGGDPFAGPEGAGAQSGIEGAAGTQTSFCVVDGAEAAEGGLMKESDTRLGPPVEGDVMDSFVLVADVKLSSSAGDVDPGAPQPLPVVEGDWEGTVAVETGVVGSPDRLQRIRVGKDVLSSVKLVVGLCGVYDVAAHYQYETVRGVEDVSTMARAMYAPDHFSKFSPTVIARTLPTNHRLPALVLLHGDADSTVPLSSSLLLGEALCARCIVPYPRAVILRGAGHAEICLDLMDARRRWHDVVVKELKAAVDERL